MQSDPWHPSHYLAFGTLVLPLANPSVSASNLQNQEREHDEEDWRVLAPDSVYTHLADSPDEPLKRSLQFLILHRFAHAACLSPSPDLMYIRVYLVPYDLAGAAGALRARRQSDLGKSRRFLDGLLPALSRDPRCWLGRGPHVPQPCEPGRTLSELYEQLPSPAATLSAASTPATRRLLDFSDALESDIGIRSRLHLYQRRSVAAMVQRETDPRNVPNPLFVPVTGTDGQEFWYQPGTMEVLRERSMEAPCRGGILCEELGTGKTVMILALISCTRNQISSPEPAIMDTRPVLTPLALRHFPSGPFAEARDRLDEQPAMDHGVPSLVELLLHSLATRPVDFVPPRRRARHDALREAVDSLEHYTGPRRDNLPFYLESPSSEPIDEEREGQKRAVANSPKRPRVLYLTSATLIIVPPNLLLQWKRECSVHCDDSLRLCVLKNGDAMPPARVLASEYDIILMTYPRFTLEDKIGGPTREHTVAPLCQCPEYDNVRIPKCTCSPPAGVSPLSQIRWKRLVIDEGHVSATLDTVLTPFTSTLSVERRWIVTGTPTTNLLGLSLGRSSADADPEPDPLEEGVEDAVGRVWTDQDAQDLKKLGNMIAHFVGLPQLRANPRLMGTHVRDALFNRCKVPGKRGETRRPPRAGATDVLMQLMAAVMIRHRISDVEEEIRLPPVSQDLVLLDLEPVQVKSYNALQAVVAINAVTSEREGLDYFFHQKNTKHLQEVIQNFSQVMFWSVDENLYNAAEIMQQDYVSKFQDKLAERPDDAKLLRDAVDSLSHAWSDTLWRAIQQDPNVPFRVHGLDPALFAAWTRTPSAEGFMHSDRIQGLRALVLERPLTSADALVERAGDDARRRKALEREMQRGTKKRKKGEKGAGPSVAAADPRAVQKGLEIEAAIESLDDAQLVDAANEPQYASALVAQSLIAHTRLGSTGSSKLNYIINEVLEHSPREKILIFSESVLSLAHIADALELVGIEFLRFTTAVSARVREQFVRGFETMGKYRVFLMELKHGARGLNLTSASRVIFCEPVWQADVESQAIKRCHRIGQTRPITVKTLAIRGTSEEEMARRRAELKAGKGKTPRLIDEVGMRTFIANPKFLTHRPTELVAFDHPLVRIPPPEAPALSRTTRTSVEEASASPRKVAFAQESPPKKRVRVASPPGEEDEGKRRRVGFEDVRTRVRFVD
ncbi:unnamed protein product [Mycena citricolor]|uniref:Helicase C-terminal domain-containing protein n=1 Tax=Mycena citricolor TaxID=2018698 RepID=A0AAD2JX46_9AGAR|nr:unnamed protein product [Mycena citricolor]